MFDFVWFIKRSLAYYFLLFNNYYLGASHYLYLLLSLFQEINEDYGVLFASVSVFIFLIIIFVFSYLVFILIVQSLRFYCSIDSSLARLGIVIFVAFIYDCLWFNSFF